MATFTLSCFGLLLYLWSAFGGPVPLKPRGYQFKASFDEATQLAQEADVRISGVTVGKVKKIELGDDGRTEATIEMDEKYAPVRSDSRGDPAPEDAARRDLRRDDARHEAAPRRWRRATSSRPRTSHRRSSSTRSSAPSTPRRARRSRSGSRRWRWASPNAAATSPTRSASLEPFAVDTNEVLKTLNSQARATKQLIRDTGEFFEALTENDEQLADLIVNSNRVFGTTAQRDQEIRETFIALPTFIDESKKTLRAARVLRGEHEPADHRPAPVGARREQDAVERQGVWRPTSTASCRPSGRRSTHRRRASRPASASSTACGRCWASSIRSCATSTRSCRH